MEGQLVPVDSTPVPCQTKPSAVLLSPNLMQLDTNVTLKPDKALPSPHSMRLNTNVSLKPDKALPSPHSMQLKTNVTVKPNKDLPQLDTNVTLSIKAECKVWCPPLPAAGFTDGSMKTPKSTSQYTYTDHRYNPSSSYRQSSLRPVGRQLKKRIANGYDSVTSSDYRPTLEGVLGKCSAFRRMQDSNNGEEGVGRTPSTQKPQDTSNVPQQQVLQQLQPLSDQQQQQENGENSTTTGTSEDQSPQYADASLPEIGPGESSTDKAAAPAAEHKIPAGQEEMLIPLTPVPPPGPPPAKSDQSKLPARLLKRRMPVKPAGAANGGRGTPNESGWCGSQPEGATKPAKKITFPQLNAPSHLVPKPPPTPPPWRCGTPNTYYSYRNARDRMAIEQQSTGALVPLVPILKNKSSFSDHSLDHTQPSLSGSGERSYSSSTISSSAKSRANDSGIGSVSYSIKGSVNYSASSSTSSTNSSAISRPSASPNSKSSASTNDGSSASPKYGHAAVQTDSHPPVPPAKPIQYARELGDEIPVAGSLVDLIKVSGNFLKRRVPRMGPQVGFVLDQRLGQDEAVEDLKKRVFHNQSHCFYRHPLLGPPSRRKFIMGHLPHLEGARMHTRNLLPNEGTGFLSNPYLCTKP